MGRIAWGLAALALAAASAAVAQGVPGLLPYGVYSPDERLALAGKPVLAEADARLADTVRKEMARVVLAQRYDPAPAIWKIGDADTTIYLFGTVHSLPPGFRWRNPGLEGVIVGADTLLLESIEGEDAADALAAGVKITGAPPLIDRVSHRSRAQLAELQGLLPPEMVAELDTMPSWIAAMSIGTIRDLLAGDVPSEGADDWLEKQFRATGRRIEAIENSAQVMTNINAVPERVQRMMLEAAILAPERTHDDFDVAAHAWAQGRVGPDSPLMIMPESIDPGAAFADPLLAQRNSAWVESLIGRLKAQRGTILFAAGAGHFVGPGSVIDLLAKRGLRVERVQ